MFHLFFYLYQDRSFIKVKDAYALSLIDDNDMFEIAMNCGFKKPSFHDVNPKDWFCETVERVNHLGLMYAMDNKTNSFKPENDISQGMVATILYRMAKVPKVEFKPTFNDVTNSKLWYSDAIILASESGVVSGYQDGRFAPDDNITRQDLAIMLRNYAKTNGINTKVNVDFNAFVDGEKIASYAQSAMAFCIDKQIISGSKKEDGVYLNPSDNATRAECAKMFLQLNELIALSNK